VLYVLLRHGCGSIYQTAAQLSAKLSANMGRQRHYLGVTKAKVKVLQYPFNNRRCNPGHVTVKDNV